MPPVASHDETSLHYRVIGDGPRNVLLVHGWMVSGAVFDGLVELLDTTGLRLPPAFLREKVVHPIRGARLAYLPGPGHYLQVERPAETATLLTSFLAGLGRT